MTFVQSTRFGLALAALRNNELRAQTLGHDVARLKIAAFIFLGANRGPRRRALSSSSSASPRRH